MVVATSGNVGMLCSNWDAMVIHEVIPVPVAEDFEICTCKDASHAC